MRAHLLLLPLLLLPEHQLVLLQQPRLPGQIAGGRQKHLKREEECGGLPGRKGAGQ